MMILNECIISVMRSKEIFILLVVILLDILLGISKGFINKKLNSNIGLIGLIKHSIVIFIIVIFGSLAPIFQLDVFFTGLVAFYIFQYILSIIESLIKIGIPLPNYLVKKIRDLEGTEDYKKYEDISDTKILEEKRKE